MDNENLLCSYGTCASKEAEERSCMSAGKGPETESLRGLTPERPERISSWLRGGIQGESYVGNSHDFPASMSLALLMKRKREGLRLGEAPETASEPNGFISQLMGTPVMKTSLAENNTVHQTTLLPRKAHKARFCPRGFATA